MGTRGPDGPGEVWVKIRGGSERFLAWSESPLPKGAKVLVIGSRGARAVDVVEWSDPLDEVPQVPGAASLPGDDRSASPPSRTDGAIRGNKPPLLYR